MPKKILFISFFCFILNSFAQEEIKSFKNYLKTSPSDIKQVIPIVNKNNDDISLFIMDARKVYGYILDKNFNIKKQLSSDDRSRKYKTLIGNSISQDKEYRVYFANVKKNKFATINFSYINNNSSFKEFSLKSNNEKFIQTAVIENKFYLITVIKKTSILNIYSFDNNGNYKINKIDFSNDRFISKENNKTSLYELLTNSGLYGTRSSTGIKKIDENTPTSIEIASAFRKLYLKGNKIIFSFDQNRNFSQIITIDLTSFESEIKRFEKPFNKTQSISKKSNTYINGDYLYTIASTPEKFTFTVKNFNSGDVIKEYSTTVNDSITFKNTPIIQEGGMYDKYREMEKTKKFLRKITTGDIGISVYNSHNKYQIYLGGKQEINSGGMMMPMGGIGMPIAGFGAATVFFNPSYFAYNSYTNTKSTHIKGYFDVNFDHIKGEMEKNVFDKIKNYQKNNSTSKKGEVVFKYKDFYILGNYFSRSKEYRLIKFQD